MKIQSVNSLNYVSKHNLPKSQNFKGLWGKDECDEYITDGGYGHTQYTSSYFPFKDETQAEISKVVKEHESYQDGLYSTGYSVSVQSKLPFTKKDFQEYLSNSISDLKRAIIDRYILDNDLRR